jgi:hypothetical protein
MGGVRITSPPGLSLDLNFMIPGSMPSGITFTRASTGTYIDATGTVQTAATNTPRWDYDPVTHGLRGVLIEEGRTNLVLNSGDASNASWVKSNITVAAPVVTGAQTTAPDGTLTGTRVVLPAVSAAGNATILNLASAAGTAAPWTATIWAKGSVGGEILYLFTTQAAVTYYRTQITLTTTWQRFTLTTPNLTLSGWTWAIGCDRRDASQTGILAQTIFVWGGQVEAGAAASSYIPTTAATVTRALDICTMPTAAWFNANTTTLQAEIYAPVAPPGAIAGFGDGANFGNSFYLTTANAIRAGGKSANATPFTVGAINKLAATNTATQIQYAMNGGSVGSGVQSASALTTTTLLAIGCNPWSTASGEINGHMRRVRYWPRVLTNAELQSVTT